MAARLKDIRLEPITQWSVGIKPTWSVSEVRSALRAHVDGDFASSSLLVDSMLQDDVIPGITNKRIDAILSNEFDLQPVEEPNRQLSIRLVNKFKPLWWDMFPESAIRQLFRWKLLLGVGVGFLDWTRGGSTWTATLRVLHPQFLRWDEYQQKWLFRAREGEIEVTPGDGRWVMLVDGHRGWMDGAVMPLGIPWLAKQQTVRDWNRYNERHGLPIIKAMAPSLAAESEKDQFWDDMRGLTSEIVAQLPTHIDEHGAKFDLDLLEAKDSNWKSFEAFLSRCDRRFMIHILGSHLSTEIVGQGSLAAAKQHAEAEQKRAESDAEELSTALRDQALHPICALNVAGASLDVTPWPKWDTEPPADTVAEVKEQTEFATMLQQLAKAGYEPEDVDELAERHGLKLKKLPTPTPVTPPAQVAPNEEQSPPVAPAAE
jgi:hypothetical protein